jgi:iron complex outermembrane receptor protein
MKKLRNLTTKIQKVAVLTFFALVSSQHSSFAQTTQLSGKIISASDDLPLEKANVLLISALPGLPQKGTASNADGVFAFQNLKPGSYKIIVTFIGFARKELPNIEIKSGESKFLTIVLEPTGVSINPILVTASRRPEKLLDAPAAVSVIEAADIESRATLTVSDHLKGLPGIDVMQSGLATTDIAVRGFNEVFAGSLLLLTDNRIARVPSLRLNVYSLMPATNDDIERIEVVSGPGSALYGPNSANGVLHILTKSPFQSEGTIVSIGGGERSVLMSTFRHARKFGDKIGLKISAQYFQGNNWEYFDPADPDSIIKGRQTVDGRIDETGLIANERDFKIDKYSVDARLDFKLSEDATLIFNSAVNQIDEIVVTPIGSARSNGWKYTFFQTRFKYKDLFAQIFTNRSNSGDTYFFRSGDVIFDRSKLTVGQIQHFLPLGERQNFTYGFDALLTRPDTRNTINGNYETDDDINELGAYVQSETVLSASLKLITAARLDNNSRLDDIIFSPRAALVYKTPRGNNFRLTYNKAFRTPTVNNLFLDILTTPDAFTLNRILGSTYSFNAGTNIRAQGVPGNGFHFNVNENGPQFRSPFAALDTLRRLTTSDFIDFNDPVFTNFMWNAAKTIIITGFRDNLVQNGLPENIASSLTSSLANTIVPREINNVKNSLKQINLETQAFEPVDGVTDIPRLKPTITQTFEIGYKGLLANKMTVALDVYHSKIRDFIGPLAIETPNVFLEAASLRASIAQQITDNFSQSTNFFLKSVLNQLDDPNNGGNGDGTPVDELVSLFSDSVAAIPLGTVSPREAIDPTAVLLTFRNFGNISLSGFDVSFAYYLNPSWTFSGNYSYVSRNLFEKSQTQVHDIPLNAPKHKLALSASYSNRRLGIVAELSGRYVDSFPFQSGELIGRVDDYTVFDFNIEGHLSEQTKLALTISNLFNNVHRELVGAPKIGRLALLRLTRSL